MYSPAHVAYMFAPVVRHRTLAHACCDDSETGEIADVPKQLWYANYGTTSCACLYAADSGPLVKCVEAPR
jgi:hypothetical protein